MCIIDIHTKQGCVYIFQSWFKAQFYWPCLNSKIGANKAKCLIKSWNVQLFLQITNFICYVVVYNDM